MASDYEGASQVWDNESSDFREFFKEKYSYRLIRVHLEHNFHQLSAGNEKLHGNGQVGWT